MNLSGHPCFRGAKHQPTSYCVLTATLVEPRVTLPPSLNRTKIRFAAGSKGTLPLPCTKIPKVGVALALICVITLGPIAEIHAPVPGFVSHSKRFTGNVAAPVSAEAVIVAVAPTFTVATEKAPVPLVPGMVTMPSLVVVAARATMSAIGVAEAESSKVFSPTLIGAGSLFAQLKLNCTSVGGKGAVGVKANTKLCAAPAAMFAGASGNPMT